MDLLKAIEELRQEKRRIDDAIAALEQTVALERPARKRRAWDAGSRRAASERMRKYWEQRRRPKPGEGKPPSGN